MSERNDPSFVKFLETTLSKKNYLGDVSTVDSILRHLVKAAVSPNEMSKNSKEYTKSIDTMCRDIANIFLGKNKNFTCTKWNSPGNIDVYIAKIEGVDSEDPVERVSGGLLNMVVKMLKFSKQIGSALPEQWQWQANAIIGDYTQKMMGIPKGYHK